MSKIVINKCYGGFNLSEKACKELNLRKDELGEYRFDGNRNDFNLVSVVERLGDEANGQFAKLKIVEVPDDVDWAIEEYDGIEWIREKSREWG
jgi:hypothetical protein